MTKLHSYNEVLNIPENKSFIDVSTTHYLIQANSVGYEKVIGALKEIKKSFLDIGNVVHANKVEYFIQSLEIANPSNMINRGK